MNEPLPDLLLATSRVLHWLGRYNEASALILLSRLLRAREIGTLDALEKLVVAEENAPTKCPECRSEEIFVPQLGSSVAGAMVCKVCDHMRPARNGRPCEGIIE